MIQPLLLTLLGIVFASMSAFAADPLSSWNDTESKRSILAFVEKVTTAGSPDFVNPAERIATFDNDGCLWAEQPMYTQLFFVRDRIMKLAPQNPEWKEKEPFASVLDGEMKTALASGEKALFKLMMAAQTGMTTEAFRREVSDWIATAKHPKTGRAFTEMVYQPMLELLAYLRLNGFKTFIVSGGGVEFMRPWTERVYGIPPEQVVGSSVKTEYELRDGKPVILRLPEMDFVNKADKPLGILSHIGRRPLMAFGNSDGDFQMLEWTTAGEGARFGALIHHTDAEREWAYDRDSHVGKLKRGLEEGEDRGWAIVDMKNDWKVIFPEEE